MYTYRANPNGLVGSAGMKMLGEGEWKTKKHAVEYRRQWSKVHMGIDVESLEIRTIEVASIRVGDAQVLPDLLNQIPRADVSIPSVVMVLTIPREDLSRLPNGMPRLAILPARMNGKPWKDNAPGANVRNETLHATQRLGRTLWKNDSAAIFAKACFGHPSPSKPQKSRGSHCLRQPQPSCFA